MKPKKKSIYSTDYETKVPVLLYGQFFMTTDVVKERFHQENVVVLQSKNPASLYRRVNEYGSSVMLFHLATNDDLTIFLDILKEFSKLLASGNLQMVVVAGQHYQNLQNTFRTHNSIEVVSNDFKMDPFITNVLGKQKMLAERQMAVRKSRLNPSKPELMILKGQPRKTPVSTVGKAPTAAKPSEKQNEKQAPQPQNQKTSPVKPVPNSAAKPVAMSVANSVPSKPEGRAPAQKPADTKSPMFNAVSNKNEVDHLIQESIQLRSKAIVFNERLSRKVEVKIVSYDRERRLLTAKVKSGKLENLVENQPSDVVANLLINFNLKRARVFFRTQKFNFGSDQITVDVPDTIFDVQRRKSFRLQIFPNESAFVNLVGANGQSTVHQIYDLGSGGACLFAEESEAKAWLANQKHFKEIHLLIGERAIVLQAPTALHARPGPDGRVLVGFKFPQVSARDECYLDVYVYRESMPYLSGAFIQT